MSSLESLLVASIPDGDRELLRHGAVLQYVTKDLAVAATGSEDQAERLLTHPLLEGSGVVRSMPLGLRQELLKGWDDQATRVLARVAQAAPVEDPLDARLYARLASATERPVALQELSQQIDAALSAEEPNVARAHDLTKLLDAWPIDVDPVAVRLRDQTLTPRLRRYSRTARDREITRLYLERDFERRATELLLSDTDQWMLQLHAPGGRGKTMFLRHFLSRYCPQHNIPVARIDFDYVARIATVTRQPWRLLLALAGQLDSQLPDSPFRYMLRSYGNLQALLFAEVLPRRRSSGELDDSWGKDYAAVDAAQNVPRQFRTELGGALGGRPVVVVLDTLENVLHTQGASVDSVLAALDEVRSHPSEGVPGLRLLLSGRFDLQGIHRGGDGNLKARAASFEETWVGSKARIETIGSSRIRIGRHVISVELPPFSPEESLEYLNDVCGLRGTAEPKLLDAIVARCAGNPLKLALLAEQVRGDPSLTAEEVESFESVELFFLVDRVVDRLPDPELQWLLRWGVLTNVLTRDFAEGVIWPALIDYIEHRRDYDDPGKDAIPESRHEVKRWTRPHGESLKQPGAKRAAWNRLLEYAAESSWVSEEEDLPDAVVFHPETREPLRRLLRQGGHPAYHDIQARALRYWQAQLDTDDPDLRVAAVRGVMFHAFQPWVGQRPSAMSVWNELLARFRKDRRARAEAAEEVLQAASRPEIDDTDRPKEAALARAHLELGERLVDEAAASGAPIDEARLSAYVLATEPLAAGVERRFGFLDAVLRMVRGEEDSGWELFIDAMTYPDTDPPAHVELVASWLSARTPPGDALQTIGRLAEGPGARDARAMLHTALARGLVAAEHWHDALEAARLGGQLDLAAAALLGQGRAREVLGDQGYGTLRRAEAALLVYDTDTAMQLLGEEPATGRRFFLEGRAQALSGITAAARSSLSSAASAEDHLVAVEAVLALARLLIDEGEPEQALDVLERLKSPSKTATLRKISLESIAVRDTKDEEGLKPRLAYELLGANCTLGVPASIAVDIELGRIEAQLVEDYKALGLALLRTEGTGALLLAARGMARIGAMGGENAGPLPVIATGMRRQLALDPDGVLDEPGQLLGAIELLRVMGETGEARALLDKACAKQGLTPAVERAMAQASARLEVADAGVEATTPRAGAAPDTDEWGPLSQEPLRLRVRLARDRDLAEIRARMDVPPSDAEEFRGRKNFTSPAIGDGPYALSKAPVELFEALGQALMVDYLQEHMDSGRHDGVLELELGDEPVAGLPWELATINNRPLHGEVALVRRIPGRGGTPSDTAVHDSPNVLVAVAAERKDRGHVRELLAETYGRTYDPRPTKPFALIPDPGTRILHLVAEIIQTRHGAGILIDDNTVTARNLAHWIGNDGQARLLMLDLALASGDTSAAEQLMLANEFGWSLCVSAPEVSVLSGVFAAGNDHIARLPVLANTLKAGTPLWHLAGELQRFREPLPRGGHPLRDAVALVTAAPDRQFRLEAST